MSAEGRSTGAGTAASGAPFPPARTAVLCGFAGACLALAATGCAGAGAGSAEADPAPARRAEDLATLRCDPPTRDVAPDVPAESLAGEYALIVEARSGERSGARAAGELRLVPWEDGAADAPLPPPALRGTTSVDFRAVGAADTGDPASQDPAAPGVLAFGHRTAGGAPEITLRVGSHSNAGGMRFDDSYTVLRVRGAGPRGFHGVWESGAPSPVAGGHFCAERL